MGSLSPASLALALAAGLDALAALAHLACIALGAPAYRLMGAGERMARAAEAGQWRPTLLTLVIAAGLAAMAFYAGAAAAQLAPLPLQRALLLVFAAVLLVRALAFPWLKPVFPDNSALFWRVSSGICLVMALAHGWGAWRLP